MELFESNALPLFGLWLGLAVCLAGTLGFLGGYYTAHWREHRADRLARSTIARLFQTVLQALDTAQDLCGLLEHHPGRFLKPDQLKHLDRRREGLLEMLNRLICRHSVKGPEAPGEPKVKASQIQLEWLRDPVDPATALPARAVFDSNLKRLLTQVHETGAESVVVLVRIDRFESLVSRFGRARANYLAKKLASMICRGVRDVDFVAQLAPDLMALLLPGLDLAEGGAFVQDVRDTVRAYHFQLNEEGPEVLLTASFGYTVCRPYDQADQILDRARDALSRSQQRGRNQLHAHDGAAVLHCTGA